MEKALLNILRAQGLDAQSIVDYLLLDQKTVLASADLFPLKQSHWFLVDLDRGRASRPISTGYGKVETTVRDLSGNEWLILHSNVDAPGYNSEEYVALLPARDQRGDFLFRAIELASFKEGDSNQNLCLYFSTDTVVDIDGRFAVERHLVRGADSISFGLQQLNCRGLTTHRMTVKLAPDLLGFSSVDKTHTEIRTIKPEWN